MVEATIELTDALKYIESPGEKPYFFINPSDALATFFTYKGRMVELNKLKISMELGKIKESEVYERIRSDIISSAKYGEWLVFNIDKNSCFNLKNFFKKLNLDLNSLCNSSKNTKRDYFIETKLLKDSEDYDNFHNKGFWAPNDKFSISFLTSCDEKDINELIQNNEAKDFKLVFVK